jgi:hypothetical protein
MSPAEPANPPTSRDRNAKSASRAAALVVAMLAMVVEIAPAVFLMAGGGSLAAVLATAPAERIAPNAQAGERRSCLGLAAGRPRPLPSPVTSDPATSPAAAALLERLALPPPALA